MNRTALPEPLDFGRPEDYRRLELPAPRLGREGSLELPASSLEALAAEAFHEIAFRLPKAELEGFGRLAQDPEASEAERFVASSLIRNAAIAAEGILPLCQDTGIATVYGWKGAEILAEDEEGALSRGAAQAWEDGRLRASVLLPRTFFAETNSGDNLPALVDLRPAPRGSGFRLCFSAKGGGSANRTSLSMSSPALLDEAALEAYLAEKIRGLGASGCPPYRISFVAGGLSPAETLHALELAGLGLLDLLPETCAEGGLALRDRAREETLLRLAEESGIGAQFGGRRLALDARAIRLPRHAASLPLALGVSCSARRQARALIDAEGIKLERLEADPARFLPREQAILPGAKRLNLDRPLPELAAELASHSAGDFLLLSGTVVLARDAAHARFRAELRAGRSLPRYLFEHPVFYAGPTEAAPGEASGSIGPTTAGRMDDFLEELLSRGASLVSLAKGGRSAAAAASLKRHGGSYLAAIGGAAALAAREQVLSSRVIDHADLGMEAVRLVVLKELPVLLAIDARGEDFYARLSSAGNCPA